MGLKIGDRVVISDDSEFVDQKMPNVVGTIIRPSGDWWVVEFDDGNSNVYREHDLERATIVDFEKLESLKARILDKINDKGDK